MRVKILSIIRSSPDDGENKERFVGKYNIWFVLVLLFTDK